MANEIELPTLEFINKSRFDCHNLICEQIWKNLQKYHNQTKCRDTLYLFHQKIPKKLYQVICRHGDGEAVYIENTAALTLETYEASLVKFINDVHHYKGFINDC